MECHARPFLTTAFGAATQLVRLAFSSIWRLEAQFQGVQFEGKAKFIGRPIISVAPGSEFRLGSGVRVNSSQRANPLGCFQPSVLRTMAPGARLALGRNLGLSGAVICAGLEIDIGEGTLLGSGAMILDNDFHHPAAQGWEWVTDSRTRARPVRIGRGVFIGSRAIIMKGVTIGDGAVIGAGAVVTRDVPAGARAVGNPARILVENAALGAV